MPVTFHRPPDHEWPQVLIKRDDRVVYRLHAGPVTVESPHDLVHFAVEDALGIADGIWGAIAGGVVFARMQHVSGRRPPHALTARPSAGASGATRASLAAGRRRLLFPYPQS